MAVVKDYQRKTLYILANWMNNSKICLNTISTPVKNLMFFWPRIMNWLYINYQLDAQTIIYS